MREEAVKPIHAGLAQIEKLIAQFPRFLDIFSRNTPFSRRGQLEHHRETIARRRELGSVAKAIDDDRFIASLYRTLRAWGIGIRASSLKPRENFAGAIRSNLPAICELENMSLDDPALDVGRVGRSVWRLIDGLDIVSNTTRIVPGSKALHHLLPELVVPMDRAYTQAFFQWQNAKFQYEQDVCFVQAFAAFAETARRANPAQYVGQGWNTSLAKVIDNALVGMVREQRELPNGARASLTLKTSRPNTTRLPTESRRGIYSEEVRAYCTRQYVQMARAIGKREISIRAGDAHDALGYKNRLPLVCSAIGASLFAERNNLRRLAVDGPLNGANTVFRFELL
jgi:hypothetical protein